MGGVFLWITYFLCFLFLGVAEGHGVAELGPGLLSGAMGPATAVLEEDGGNRLLLAAVFFAIPLSVLNIVLCQALCLTC